MTLDEKIAAFKRGECPGCGGPLVMAASGDRHYREGSKVETDSRTYAARRDAGRGVFYAKGRYSAVMSAGEPVSSGVKPRDPRLCPFDSDRLFTIQLLAGFRDGKSMLRDEDYGQPSPRTPTY